MNINMIFKVIGRLLLLVAVLMLLPVMVGVYFGDDLKTILSFLGTALVVAIIGFLLNMQKVKIRTFFTKEGLIIVALSWVLMSFFGGLPLYFSGEYKSLIDACFEISSGFTTTGATVSTNVEILSKSILFWRSFTHLIGGMGVLVFVLAIMPQMKEDSIYLMKAEVPGPVFGKIVSKLGDTARILYKIYLGLTALLILALYLAGMPLFDSVVHAFGTAGTGGFGIKNTSIGYYNSPAIELIIGIAMLIFGVNFNLYYFILIGKIKEFFRSEELKWYLSIVGLAVVVITLNIYSAMAYPFPESLRHTFFTVSSIMTTTGYSTADFAQWPLFSHVVLLVLMFIGGCAGSTAGGIKVARVGTAVKSALAEIKRARNPKRVLTFHFEGKLVDIDLMKSLTNYFLLYIFTFAIMILLISLDSPNFTTAFSAVAATFNNIGPGLDVVGPTGSFAGFSDFSKIILIFAMIAGRLEILPMLILFSPGTWKRT
ncbi:TrkH family potassium uptake protein [Clostridiales bacterium COT073_COT-073]|nr:TrkH family potassium uptake protein [Clostridiales bacterium COT073_COT-073]